jgi:hypothetical protein
MAKAVRIKILRGLGDYATSAGMDALAAKLKAKYPTAAIEVLNWYQWQNVIADFEAHRSDIHIAIGYSMGANEVTEIAEALTAGGVKLDLLVSMDPTVWYAMHPLHANVTHAICFHNSGWSLVGHARVIVDKDGKQTGSADADFKGTLEMVEIAENHMKVDWDETVCAKILDAVAKIAA